MTSSFSTPIAKPIANLLRSALVLVLIVFSSAQTLAQSDQRLTSLVEEVAHELRKAYGTTAQMDALIAKQFGQELPSAKTRVLREHYRALFFHEKMPEALLKILLPIYRPSMTDKELYAVGFEGMLQVQMKGLARLAPDRQTAFVRYISEMASSLPSSVCKRMFLGQIDTPESTEIERKFFAALPLPRFEAIVSLYREAIDAELVGYPSARSINASQAKFADDALQEAFIGRLRRNVPRQVTIRVLEDPHNAEARDVCAVMLERVHALLDLDDPYKSWALTRFAESLQ